MMGNGKGRDTSLCVTVTEKANGEDLHMFSRKLTTAPPVKHRGSVQGNSS